MLATLVAPTRDLAAKLPSVNLKTFIDDRTFSGPLSEILGMKQGWQEWTA